MPNRSYTKGANHERELVNSARQAGHFALRSAGSHSPIDVIRIIGSRLELIQVKSKRSKVNWPDVPSSLSVHKILAVRTARRGWELIES